MSNDDVFITSIHVKKVRNLENFDISLSEEKRQHLIITGKNGSGKTSLLLKMNELLTYIQSDSPNNCQNMYKQIAKLKQKNEQTVIKNLIDCDKALALFIETNISFNKDYLIVFFAAKRFNEDDKPVNPKGIGKIEFKKKYLSTDRLNQTFIQYIVNLKAESAFAQNDNDNEAVRNIDEWFNRFEKHLKDIFDTSDLRLIFDRKNYNFHIQIGNNEPFGFNELSDGYSAVFSIVTELILRMEANGNKAYNQQGIVLIDEIETHLHVALQKKIMPFLCDFFPNVQFIVTTHSPFVLMTVKNAVICDLETKEIITDDLSGYSYTALVESYFDTNEYSQEVVKKIARFEELSTKDILNEQEEDERYELKRYFDDLPKFRADELAVKVQQIKLQTLARKR